MKRLLPFLVIFCSISLLQAQNYFQKGYYTPSWQSAKGIVPDGNGHYLIYGENGAPEAGILLSEIDEDGNLFWSRQLNYPNTDMDGKGFLVNGPNDWYLSGNSWQFLSSLTYVDLIKLDSNGTVLWANNYTLSGATSNVNWGISTYSGNELFMPGFANPSSFDAWMMKLDLNGNIIWSRTIGFASTIEIFRGGCATPDGGVLGYGYTNEGMGLNDIFLTKLDSTGTLEWNAILGNSGTDEVSSVIKMSNGYLFTGYIGQDIMLLRTDESGVQQWAKLYQMSGSEYGATLHKMDDNRFGIASRANFSSDDDGLFYIVDSSGVLLSAHAYGDIGTGPDDEINGAAATSSSDWLLIGTKEILPSTLNGGIYLIKTDSLGNSPCNDSNITSLITVVDTSFQITNLTPTVTSIGASATITVSDTVYNFDTDTLCACMPPDMATLSISDTTVCSSDSIMVSITAGNLNDADNWYWYSGTCGGTLIGTGNAVMLDASTTTTYYVRAEGGFAPCNQSGSCAAITITNSSVDTSVSQTGVTLTSNATSSTYQWLDCDSNYAVITGETNQAFTPTANGNYAVQVNNGSCIDTSACYTISTIGIDNMFETFVSVYPNPSDGNFTIDLGDAYTNVEVIINDVAGRTIYHKVEINGQLIPVELEQPNGLYFLVIRSEGREVKRKIIKK